MRGHCWTDTRQRGSSRGTGYESHDWLWRALCAGQHAQPSMGVISASLWAALGAWSPVSTGYGPRQHSHCPGAPGLPLGVFSLSVFTVLTERKSDVFLSHCSARKFLQIALVRQRNVSLPGLGIPSLSSESRPGCQATSAVCSAHPNPSPLLPSASRPARRRTLPSSQSLGPHRLQSP